ESEPFDPFGGGDDPQPTPADAAEPSEPRPHPLKSRFAELAASFEESPETESAPPQAAPADDASPFAGFGNDFGSAAGASESKQPASSGNPFASGDIPTGSGSPFASDPTPESEPTAASEPTPALAESETTDDSTGDSDASPFARRGSD